MGEYRNGPGATPSPGRDQRHHGRADHRDDLEQRGAADVQHLDNPGYNRDRGPALVTSLRIHVEDGLASFHKHQ
jgi:high affinity Mn2+ porin